MKAEEIKIRCSQLGRLMTDPKLKADKEAGNLSEGAKSYLLEMMVEFRTGAKKEIDTKYTKKGIIMEETAIEMYSLFCFQDYEKNTENKSNEYLTGTCDIDSGKTIIDIKCSYDALTFFKHKDGKIDDGYEWQLQGYMELYDKEEARLAYVLVDTPEEILQEEIKKLSYKYTGDDLDIAIANLIKLHDNSVWKFEERIIEFIVKRDRERIQNAYKKIEKARQFLKPYFN